MEVKCGRQIFEVTNKDLVLYNGACYQITTRGYALIAKARAKKMIKDGDMIECNSRQKPKGYNSFKVYTFNDI